MLRILTALAEQRGHLFPWAAVCFGAGVGVYFALLNEPPLWMVINLFAVSFVAFGYGLFRQMPPYLTGAALICAGLCVAGVHARMNIAPVLTYHYYGPVTGRIVHTDRSSSDKVRLTLDNVVLRGVSPDETPARVRVSLHGEQGYFLPEPGTAVMMTAHLSPPQGPVEPGGFDFRRSAWFQKLGAVGYTRTPALRVAPSDGDISLFWSRVRQTISTSILADMNPATAGFAVAITTGDRSHIDRQHVQSLRDSNLAHLLAISGLHMGLLVGLIFGGFRIVLSLFARIALNYPIKKLAAIGAIGAAAVYLMLSGGNVATQRAFVMVTVMLVAVLFDYRAITLNGVALAGFIVLVISPESLTGPGFQMSFAATIALVAAFRAIRDQKIHNKTLHFVAMLAFSSLVAGLATAPFAAAHFNRVAHFGLLANVLSVPVMAFVVMPAVIMTAVLSIIGWEEAGYFVLDLGIRWILRVAEWVSGLESAVGYVPSPTGYVLPLITISGLFVSLWQGRFRWIGLLGIAAALAMWSQTNRPDVLISDSGRLVGVLQNGTRVLNKERGDGFVASNWLENDGLNLSQSEASVAWIYEDTGFTLADGRQLFVINGRGAAERIEQHCAPQSVIVTARELSGEISCMLFDATTLKETGAIAIYEEAGAIRIETTAERSGNRLWTQ